MERTCRIKLAFPPRTSSPIIRHAAVWIVLAFRSSTEAMIRDARPLDLDPDSEAAAGM